MALKSLRAVNLNLLPILQELLARRSVAEAARALNMSPSSVSDGLGKLRAVLGDELLVREGRTYRLSGSAERIKIKLDEAMLCLDGVLSREAFNPAKASGCLRIAAVDYIILLLGQQLLPMLKEQAPGITLQFSPIDNNSYANLKKGNVDVVLGLPQPDGRLAHRLIVEHDAVCVCAVQSRFHGPLTEAEFWSARHIAFSPGGDPSTSIHSEVLKSQGRNEFTAVIVHTLTLLPFLVNADLDAIGIVPRPLANFLNSVAPVRVLELPFTFPVLRVTASWDAIRTNEPLIAWLVELLSRAAREANLPTHRDGKV